MCDEEDNCATSVCHLFGITTVSSPRLEREDAGEAYSRSGVRGSGERQEHTQRELNRLSQ